RRTKNNAMKLLVLYSMLAITVAQGCAADNVDSVPYSSLAAQTGSKIDRERGSSIGDYQWAAQASNLREAKERWQHFLHEHSEAEDGVEVRLIRRAQYELLRVYYLCKEVDNADAMLKRIQKEDKVAN
ncbi:MAG: hypothetical protein M3463_16045, partial [Verrucomicrobiota bacterium]|nr:hypothetical protein [Verrucomicrobiota bacterium]